MNTTRCRFTALLAASPGLAAPVLQGADNNTNTWSSTLVAPVANPIFFESPAINNELRPVFMYHELNDDFAIPGDVEVYALQFRLKLTERLALIATKDGFVKINPDSGPSADGWADIGGGLKYALIQDEESQFLLTPGVKFEIPCGDNEVFQGNGDGEFDVFVSAAKGIGELQLMGSLGARLPIDTDEEASQLHLCECLDLGVAYEEGVDHSDGIFDKRFTADLVWKFCCPPGWTSPNKANGRHARVATVVASECPPANF